MMNIADNPHLHKTDVMRSAVFNEDCIAVMKRYPDKFFNLAIVDPPYGNIDAIGLADNKKKGKQATKRTNYKLFENIAPDDEYLELLSLNFDVFTASIVGKFVNSLQLFEYNNTLN